jgi:hypothetical protein
VVTGGKMQLRSGGCDLENGCGVCLPCSIGDVRCKGKLDGTKSLSIAAA